MSAMRMFGSGSILVCAKAYEIWWQWSAGLRSAHCIWVKSGPTYLFIGTFICVVLDFVGTWSVLWLVGRCDFVLMYFFFFPISLVLAVHDWTFWYASCSLGGPYLRDFDNHSSRRSAIPIRIFPEYPDQVFKFFVGWMDQTIMMVTYWASLFCICILFR